MYPMIQSMILTPTPDLKDNLRARILPTPCIVHFLLFLMVFKFFYLNRISIIKVFQTKCFYGQINNRLEKNPPFSIADSATFTFLLVYHKHDRSTFSINWWVRQCDPNHLINGTERSTGSALSSWSSLSGFDWGHYYHKHSCLLFSLSLSVTVMLCREKTVMLMSTKISTWVLYISALCSWYCCQSHSHCHDLGPIKMRLKTKWKIFSCCVSYSSMHADQTIREAIL